MRLIDADALIKAIVRKEPFNDCARVVIAECMEEVRHAPTINPERRMGRNRDADGLVWCNTCGYGKERSCPNCGLTMEEGE